MSATTMSSRRYVRTLTEWKCKSITDLRTDWPGWRGRCWRHLHVLKAVRKRDGLWGLGWGSNLAMAKRIFNGRFSLININTCRWRWKTTPLVCLRKPEAERKICQLPLWRYPAQQGLKLNDDDDDDDEEEEEDYDDNLHQGMGCHSSALCLQWQVDKKSFLLPQCLICQDRIQLWKGKRAGCHEGKLSLENSFRFWNLSGWNPSSYTGSPSRLCI